MDFNVLGSLSGLFGNAAGLGEYQMGAQQAQAQQQNAYYKDLQNILGFTTSWDFSAPEQYGPERPKPLEPRWFNRYDDGRDAAWLSPLRDPGRHLLKVAAVLAIYPAIYLAVTLLTGLFNALF